MHLAPAISERAGFFDDAYDDPRVRPGRAAAASAPLTHPLQPRAPLRPGLGDDIEAPDGARIVYTGDTGPSESVVDFSCDADLLLVEAALRLSAHDDAERGHLTAEEAIDLATRARARSALLVHYSAGRRRPSSRTCARRPGRGSARPFPG